MTNISFQAITSANVEAVQMISLHENQKNFIETADACLREAASVEQWRPVAILADEQIVGFAMYGSFGKQKDTWIDRIMIDKQQQGKGYGKQAMLALIEIVLATYNVKTIYLSIVEGNSVARQLYESIGFTYMNEKDPSNGELMFCYTVQ